MKNTFFFLLLIISVSISGQNTLLFEDFNDGFPAGWSLIDNDGNAPYNDPAVNFIDEAWTLYEDYDSIGINDSILISTSWFEESGNADDYLILPLVQLGAGGNFIEFDIKSKDHSYPDGLEVLYSVTDQKPWTFTHNPIVFHTENAPSYWTHYKIELDTLGLENQQVMFAFRHFGTDQFILCLDNIKLITNDATAIDEYGSSINIYQQSTNINIDGLSKKEDYVITDLNGKIVQRGITIGLINFQANNGLYFIQIGDRTPEKIIFTQ